MSRVAKPSASLIRGWFTKATTVTIVTITALIVVSHIFVGRILVPFESNTARMKVAATMATQVQNINSIATSLANAKRPGKLYTFRTALANELDRFVASNRSLLYGNAELNIKNEMSAQVKELMLNPVTGLDRFARDFEAQVRNDFLSDTLTVDIELAKRLQENSIGIVNPVLEALIDRFSVEANADLNSIYITQTISIGVILLTFLLLSRALFRPIAERVILAIYGLGEEDNSLVVRHDEVTGLANRTYLLTFMNDLCSLNQEHDFRSAVLHIELKLDSGDYSTMSDGDQNEMMFMVARRLESACRSGDFISRVGDYEFILVLTTLDTDTTLDDITSGLRAKLAMPFFIDKQTFGFSSKIGIRIAGKKDRVAATILNQASAALNIARASSAFDVQIFAGKASAKSDQKEREYEELKKGLRDGQFKAYFQPIMHSETNGILGLEALARWEHPKNGILPPIHFMEMIKHRQLSNDLTRTILGNCLKSLRAWKEDDIDVPFVSVNLELEQIKDNAFIDEIKWIIDSYEEDPSRISIEFSSFPLKASGEGVIEQNLRNLADYGVRLTMNDLTDGRLNLSSIRQIGITTGKIDRADVMNIDNNPHQQYAVRQAINSAHSLDIEVIAEGIETAAERATLIKAGVDAMQGFLLSEPISNEEIGEWISDSKSQISAAS